MGMRGVWAVSRRGYSLDKNMVPQSFMRRSNSNPGARSPGAPLEFISPQRPPSSTDLAPRTPELIKQHPKNATPRRGIGAHRRAREKIIQSSSLPLAGLWKEGQVRHDATRNSKPR